jgi:hypothetical protein
MGNKYNTFTVALLSDVCEKDSAAFQFEFTLNAEQNCRIKIVQVDLFDVDGNPRHVPVGCISRNDFLLGRSRFFPEKMKVTVKLNQGFRSKIGCLAVVKAACIEEKKTIGFCFQKKGVNRWECIGTQLEEYVSVVEDIHIEEPDLQEEEEKETVYPVDYINSIIELDEKTAKTTGLTVDDLKFTTIRTESTITPTLAGSLRYLKENRALVRCPMIKVMLYDKKDSILNVDMHRLSQKEQDDGRLEITLKSAAEKYWFNLGKIKILVTV